MIDPQAILSAHFTQGIIRACGSQFAQVDPLVRPSNNPKFGDYQANFAMSLGKQTGQKPRELAEKVLSQCRESLSDLCAQIDIAGPGFINLVLRPETLSNCISRLAVHPTLGVEAASPPQCVVVDYSSPNVAKEMHVGHLRSSIIGDAIARVLAFQGHRVIRQNHLGDWGTQFGMLIERLLEEHGSAAADVDHSIADLDAFYRDAKQRFDADESFARRSRERVVKLQGGDELTLRLWHRLVRASEARFAEVYQRLDVLLVPDDIRPESFYNRRLTEVIEALRQAGHLKSSEGAEVVYPPGFKDRDGNDLPMIVRKSDGGYLYATTDLAAARYRLQELRADRVIYVTDARQAQHFAMVFATLRMTGWAPESVRLDHVPFGTILGKDNKPFKTREGGTVKLVDLLNEAEQRASAIVVQKNPDMSEAQRRLVAHVVGIGALKYADLCGDRIKDYVFDWDRMLAMDGNTAPYLQNAYVRIRSIFRKAAAEGAAPRGGGEVTPPRIAAPAERTLALKLLQFAGVVDAVGQSLEPHRLCTHLYETAAAFHQFYEACPVLTAPDAATRDSRLTLCDLTARTLKQGLGLLGIGTVEAM